MRLNLFLPSICGAQLVAVLAIGSSEPIQSHEGLALLAKELSKIENGGWREIPNSKIPLISDAELEAIRSKNGGPTIRGVNGPRAVIDAWNGAAYDPKEHMWYFTGGGHRDYGGNEVYAFDFEALSWSRLTEPSPLTGRNAAKNKAKSNCPLPAEGPPAYHTYDGITWNPETRTVWIFGTVPFCTRGSIAEEPVAWEFDPAAREWRSHRLAAPKDYAKTLWNPETNRVLVHARRQMPYEVDSRGRIHRWSERRDSTTNVGVLVYDPKRKAAFGVKHYGNRRGFYRLSLTGAVLSGPQRLDEKYPLPPDLDFLGITQGGMAYHPRSDSMVLWPGGPEVWALDLEAGTYRRFVNPTGETPPADRQPPVFSKWIYIAELDVFAGYNDERAGVWLYKLPECYAFVDPREVRACRNEDCSFPSVRDALASARDGDTIRIRPGRYRDGGVLQANRVTILADGAHLHAIAFEGKANLVLKGDDTVVEGLECSDIRVSSQNGACIRLEGKNLTLRRVHFHDSQSGLLSGSGKGRVLVEDSRFERLGVGQGNRGRAHAIYVGAIEELVLRRSRFLATEGEGHEIKSRARRTLLERNVIASLDASDSRLLDLPNGGEAVVRGNILEEGPHSANEDLIGYGLERGRNRGVDHPVNQLIVEGNTILVDREGRVVHVRSRNVPAPIVRGNIFVGGPKPTEESNRWFADRSAFGISSYPFLPEPRLVR